MEVQFSDIVESKVISNIVKGGSRISNPMQKVYRVLTASHILFTKLAPISCPLGHDALVVAVACRIVFNIIVGPSLVVVV